MDIVCGDVIKFDYQKRSSLVLLHRKKEQTAGILCRGGGDRNILKTFKIHHLVLYGLDPENDLFDPVQRFTVFRGYCDRVKLAFGRPKDNCLEAEEETDGDGDGLGGACKTDGEHGLGSHFHCFWVVWKVHHAVNSEFHLVRKRYGFWGHPYIDEHYGDENADRQFPSFYESLPTTLQMDCYDL